MRTRRNGRWSPPTPVALIETKLQSAFFKHSNFSIVFEVRVEISFRRLDFNNRVTFFLSIISSPICCSLRFEFILHLHATTMNHPTRCDP